MADMTTGDQPHEDLHDSPYLALAELGEDSRWAFGGGFDDPLEGVDTTVPAGLDPRQLAALCRALGDESLLLAQTLQRWCTHAPELEEEVAIANVALDLIGQTRMLYARSAAADPGAVPQLGDSPVPAEDRLAYFRDADDFSCTTLAVLPDEDFAGLMVRLAAWAGLRHELWRGLEGSPDPVLAAIAARARVEVSYHRELAARWVRVLAGGTEESARRTGAALRRVQPLVEELRLAPVEGADWAETWRVAGERWLPWWQALVGVEEPAAPATSERAAWRADLVTELQSVARRHPEGTW